MSGKSTTATNKNSLNTTTNMSPLSTLSEPANGIMNNSNSNTNTPTSSSATTITTTSSTTNTTNQSSGITLDLTKELHTIQVTYVGSLDVNASMKSLDFETRSLVAKECINRVCLTAGTIRGKSRARETSAKVRGMLAERPDLAHSGTLVTLTITSSYLNISSTSTGQVIARHEMPNISFVSGGERETVDYVAYVAKDPHQGRACFVLECPGGLAQDVIASVGQAFELRFRQYVTRARKLNSNNNNNKNGPPPKIMEALTCAQLDEAEREYYNDLPGKVAPASQLPAAISPTSVPRPGHLSANGAQPNQYSKPLNGHISPRAAPRQRRPIAGSTQGSAGSNNLIDLGDPIPSPTPPVASAGASNNGSLTLPTLGDPLLGSNQYVNCRVGPPHGHGKENITSDNTLNIAHLNGTTSTPASNGFTSPSTGDEMKDPFDMKPFDTTLLEEVQKESARNGASGFSSNSSNSPSNHPLDSSPPTNLPNPHPPTSMPLQIPPSLPLCAIIDSEREALRREPWFHGPISRKRSETLVVREGDFLVRESLQTSGQFILTGMQASVRKHLLLVDPQGKVRTKDKTFESVSHLINFHRHNNLPIISAESVLFLKTPINCAMSTQNRQMSPTPPPLPPHPTASGGILSPSPISRNESHSSTHNHHNISPNVTLTPC